MRVADKLIAAPGDTPYDDLKAHLLKIYTKTDYQKAKLLLELPPLGDQRPSELMHKMLGFLPAGADTSDPGFLFRAGRQGGRVVQLPPACDFFPGGSSK